MNAKELANKRSEVLEPLHAVANELIEIDRKGKTHLMEYTDLDVAVASVTFIHILSNKKAHEYFKRKEAVDVEKVRQEMEEYGRRIGQIVYDMTGVKLNDGKK